MIFCFFFSRSLARCIESVKNQDLLSIAIGNVFRKKVSFHWISQLTKAQIFRRMEMDTKAQRHLSIYNCSSWPFSRLGARMWRVVLKVFEFSLTTHLRLLYMNVFYIFWNTKIVMLTHLLKKMKSWGPLAYFLFIIDIFYWCDFHSI